MDTYFIVEQRGRKQSSGWVGHTVNRGNRGNTGNTGNQGNQGNQGNRGNWCDWGNDVMV